MATSSGPLFRWFGRMFQEPERVRQALEEHAAGRAEVHEDTYFDNPAGELDQDDRELRVRTVHGQDSTRSLLTYKGARVDEATGSKPEYGTGIDNPEACRWCLECCSV